MKGETRAHPTCSLIDASFLCVDPWHLRCRIHNRKVGSCHTSLRVGRLCLESRRRGTDFTHLPAHESFEVLMVFLADSSRKGLRCPFDLLLPLHYTHRAVRRTRNVSGSDAPFRSFGLSAHQSLAPPGNQPRHICARAITEERLVLET